MMDRETLAFRLTTARIQNFRCIRDLTLDLDETTVLIGENNSGKTAVLKAIEMALSRPRGPGNRVFDDYDYHLVDEDASPETADPIVIELRFEEREDSSWPMAVVQRLARVITIGNGRLQRVTLRVTSAYSPDADFADTVFEFLDHEANVVGGGPARPAQLAALRDMVPVHSVAALRSTAAEFSRAGRYWRGFLSISSLSDSDRARFEEGTAALNQALIDAHQPLALVREYLERAGDVTDFGGRSTVRVDALPTRAFAALSQAQVSVASRRGARIPLRRQGEGTQSLAVLLLFHAYLASQLTKQAPLAVPLTLIEEPEAHLHPGAVRGLRDQLIRLPGQKILSTHSGDFLATVPAASVRRLGHRQGRIEAGRIPPGSLTTKQGQQFDNRIRRGRGRLLFSRCWLIVEGETEITLLEGVAEALRRPLEKHGVHLIECASLDLEVLCVAANHLGIPWYAVFDDDPAGHAYRKKALRHLGGERPEDRIVLPYVSPERLLCESGFGAVYEARMSDQQPAPTSPAGSADYWGEVLRAIPRGSSKPEAAAEAVGRMASRPDLVPGVLARIVEKAVSLARPD